MSAQPANLAFLALVFAAELGAWAGIGVGAFQLAGGGWKGALTALVAVAAAIGAWGAWAAPRSSAPRALALATKVVVFGGAVALLLATHHPRLALALAALIVVAHVGVYLTREA